MKRCPWLLAMSLVVSLVVSAPTVRAEGNGQEDFDEAMRVKVTAEDMGDLNKVVELLESAIQKGLDVDNNDFAEEMLVETLMQRAAQLSAVIQSAPGRRLGDADLQKVVNQATTDLQRAIEYDSAPPQAKVLLAQLLTLPGGDPKEALKLLNEVFEDKRIDAMPPKMQAESLIMRAKLLGETDPDKAQADFAAAIELDGKNPEYLLARADFYSRQKKYDEAVADIDAVIELHPEVAGSYLVKATILREQAKLDEAIAALDKAAEIAPSSPGIYQQRGEIYRMQGDFPKAIEQFTKVIDMHPGLMLPLIHRSEAYLNDKQYDKALADIETVMKENPELPVAHGLKAQTLASLERFPEAIEELKKLTEDEEAQPEFQLQLALYYLFANQPREAIAAYSELLEQDGDNFPALRGRADAYLNIGEHAKAVADFKKALEVEPKESGLLNNYAWVLATSPDDNVRDGKLAVELATKACEVTDNKESHILSTLAAAYAETGDFDKATEWSKKAIETFETQREAAVKAGNQEKVDELSKELAAELATFEAKKPWRERQTGDEKKPTSDEKPAEAEKK
ncbi:tetratricopeptide repeat protein [Lacipirellula sp.]|uniref:tetratricopeptide repeat protein n=1 Tax=Lacipirellula sp. TaxID=2691419 RepID=UPI003D0ECEEF